MRIPLSPIVLKCHGHDRDEIESHYKYSLKEVARKGEKYELHDGIWRLKEGHRATISTISAHAIHGGDRTVFTTPGAHGTVDSQLPLCAGVESEAISRAMERLRLMIHSELQLVLETLMFAKDKLVDLDDDEAICAASILFDTKEALQFKRETTMKLSDLLHFAFPQSQGWRYSQLPAIQHQQRQLVLQEVLSEIEQALNRRFSASDSLKIVECTKTLQRIEWALGSCGIV